MRQDGEDNGATLTVIFLPSLTAFDDFVQYLSVGVLPCMLLRLNHHGSTDLKGTPEEWSFLRYSTLTLC